MIEVLVSILILSIGLLGVAMFIGGTIVSGTRARYMNMANVLASEKLDGLTRWPSNDTSADPNIAPGGSLTGPAVCAANDIYCDEVTVNEASGANYEIQTQTVNGNPVTTIIVHTNTGCVNTPAVCGVAAPSTGGSTFTRRWLISANPSVSANGVSTTINGIRKITVLVTLNNQPANSPVSFQLSMVRP